MLHKEFTKTICTYTKLCTPISAIRKSDVTPKSDHYSSPPLIRPPLRNGKSGLIRGVAPREGYIKYCGYRGCSLKSQSHETAPGPMVRVATYGGGALYSFDYDQLSLKKH